MHKFMTLLMTVAAGVAAVACVGGILAGKKPLNSAAETEPDSPVLVAVVEAAGVPDIRNFPGRVKAARRVELAFSVSGILRELNADRGRKIGRGEVLAKLDERDFKNALDSAEARYLECREAWNRAQKLAARSVISTAEQEKTKAAYDMAAAELRQRRKAYEDTVLTAPFDGVIADRYVENFEPVKEKTPMISLCDLSRLEVEFEMPETLLRDRGMENLRSVAVCFDGERATFHPAELSELCFSPDSVLGTYDVTLRVAPLPEGRLLPGMTATVRLTFAGEPAPGVRIPARAIGCDESGNSFVWVVPEAGGLPRRRAVFVARRIGEFVEVSGELRPGDRVAVAGLRSLREDRPVRPRQPGKDGLEG